MPRPPKTRSVAFRPEVTYYKPAGTPLRELEEECLCVDELEALRLSDMDGLDQEACARRMNVAQSTFQRIVSSARGKVATALVTGKAIRIGGGNYEFVEPPARKKEENDPVIAAIALEGNEVSQHFGRAPGFAIVEIAGGSVVSRRDYPNPGPHQHGTLAGFLRDHQVSVVVVGGIGGPAQQALRANGLEIISGVSGSLDEVLPKLASGTLESGDAVCGHEHDDDHQHHDHHHHHHHECHHLGHGHHHRYYHAHDRMW